MHVPSKEQIGFTFSELGDERTLPNPLSIEDCGRSASLIESPSSSTGGESGIVGPKEHHLILDVSPFGNEGTYSCEHCVETFRKRWELNRHRKTHFSERPFHCRLEDCPMRFTLAKDEYRHVVTKHRELVPGAKIYGCPSSGCHFSCPRSDGFRRHMRRMHPELLG